LLWQRVERRKGGPSDATVDILSRQLQRDPSEISWQRLDASVTAAETVEAILALLPREEAGVCRQPRSNATSMRPGSSG
jgi:predicted kinase